MLGKDFAKPRNHNFKMFWGETRQDRALPLSRGGGERGVQFEDVSHGATPRQLQPAAPSWKESHTKPQIVFCTILSVPVKQMKYQ